MKVNITQGIGQKKSLLLKWAGSGPLQFSTAGGFNTDDTVNYFTDPVPALPTVTPSTYVSGQLSVDTSMKAISRNQKSSSRNTTDGLSSGMVSGGNSETELVGVGSIETQTFSDMNGDGYPDMVYPQSIQFTNSTGSLEDIELQNYGDYPTNSLSYQKSNSAGFSFNAFSVTGRIGAHGSNGTTTRANSGMPWSGSASVSASYNNYYNSYDKGEGYWMDINGDGLPDRIRGGGSQYMRYSLNLGKSLAGEAIFPNMITYSSHPKANASISLGGALGASANLGALASFGFGISAGASASSSKGSADVVFEDVNSDGLVDILEVSGNSTAVRYNLGNRFQTPMPLLKSGGDINFEDETISYNGSLSFGANYMFNIGPVTLIPPVVVLILWIKAGAGANVNVGLNVSETKKAFKDMNGDGYTDLVQDTNNGFIVNYSQINRTNKLKSITNTISKGRYDLDYEIVRANYNNPYAKLVVKKISVVESNVFSQNYTTDQGTKMETNYSFRNRKYDRREREDFGFDTVIKQEMNGALAERITTDYYYNNTYLMNGLIKQSMVQNGSGSLLSDIIYDYKLRRFSNSLTLIDLNSDLGIDYDKGGSEGRKMAIALLDAKVKTIHEAGGSLSTRERFTYTNKGLLKQYQYESPSSSYNTNITYQALNNNIIGVPTLVEVYEGNTQSTLLRQRRAENINTYNGDVGSYVTFDGSNDIYTDIQYYANGNIKKVIYPPNELGQRYEVNYTYDDAVTGKYVIKVKDIFNIESSATYNPLFDVVTRKVDTGGNAMVFYYDGFGRTRSIMGPNEIANGSTVPTVKYRYWTDHAGIPNNDATIKIYRASTSNFDPEYAASNNMIMTDTYSDFLGRIIQVKKDVEISGGEGRSVSGRAIFDGLGRVVKQHHPTAEAIGNQNLNSYTPPSISTVATYDSRDRVISATDEGGNTKYTTYSIENNLLKVTEEFMNQKSESYSTQEGKVVMKNDYLYQQPLTTLFEYSTIGELLSVKDPEGIATEFSYNLAGRRMQQIHPDKGITSYEYDLSGNLIRLTTDNLLNDPTINNHFIEYKYDHNRLAGIVLPDLPSGDPNPNNVIYQYGSATAGNNAGKLINKTDGAGDTVYKYGRMGEVIYELKKVRGHHIPEMYFKTYFNYDSWNRLTKIKYPDNEIVSYHYDRGGNLKSVDNNYGETYIQNIRYDYYEQREFVVYGNGTSQSYQYNTHNRRMDKYYLYSSNNIMLNNSYEYDEFANITKIKNEAYPLANGMGGAYQSYFGYDTLNRLIGTGSEQTILDGENQPIQNTFIAPTTYQLEMEYNNAGGIVLKRQHHERDQNVVPENTYDNKYEYISGTHKLSVANDTQTGNYDSFEYDYNGNAIIHSDNNGDRKMFWDEQDRLKAFYNDNNGIYQYYTYDDKGERVVKYGLEIPTQLYQNGVPVEINELKLFEFKIYPNPYVTVSSTGQYTKHYFEGSKRFASRLLDGAVRYEDPSVLYASRSAEDSEPSKPADVKSDFERYLEKSGIGDDVSVELRERPWTTGLYYLHGDHLGTATFVTNSQGDATQFFLNLPFGETMLEQMDGSYDNPFKFNAKELDEDTGLYYYGARYYNPRLSIWYGVDPLAEEFPSWSPYVYTMDNPIRFTDPDGMAPNDIVFMGLNGREIHRIKSNTVFKTYMIDINARSVAVRGLTANGGKGWIEAAMPNIIQEKGGGNTTGPIYQKYDYLIASETGYFNQYKNAGITPNHTNGLSIDDPSTVPDLDPTLVKSTIMQESMMGTYDANPNDLNNSKSDIMQANVYYSENSNDWGKGHKTQFGLTKGGGATPEESVNAGIGLMYQKGLTTSNGKTRWTGGKTWDNASKNYNGGGASNYGNVLKMRDAAKKPQPKNY
ncbi:RHS repeat-associated core domain-containing protein [Chryseobacterium binzhouense]|uniref:RHS repeat-associated core domain-containing protein n=1 Tax=Chryseobacterium binzhouense TaxID=2593646 RepID=UPI00289C016F|nr:RHS repeat-associated core domain-containing protein [Chryseobacterium binzhouense]